MTYPKHILPATVIGSYPQPDWLVNRDLIAKTTPPCARMNGIWRLSDPKLADAQDDATLDAIHDLERAGIDILTDGEIRRESFTNRFTSALDGIDHARSAVVQSRLGREIPVPRVVSKLSRSRSNTRKLSTAATFGIN